MSEALDRLESRSGRRACARCKELIGEPGKKRNADAAREARCRFIRPTSPTSSKALPLEERMAVWNLVKADRDGEILVEVSEAVRESLIGQHGLRRAGRGGGDAGGR
jgi:hypothetical protein